MGFGLFKRIIINNWQQEVVYFGNKVLGAIVPFMYVGMSLLFVTVLFRNITTLAGYEKNEVLLIGFFIQLIFYSYDFWGQECSRLLERYINTGALDYILIRPVSSLLFLTVHVVKPLKAVINYVGPLTPAWLVIDWSHLDISAARVPAAIVILVCASILYFQSQFLFALIAFWTGKSSQAIMVVHSARSQSIPLEAFSPSAKVFFTLIIPAYFSSVAASVLLGKSSALFWLLATLGITALFTGFVYAGWRLAVRQYGSASS